MRKSFTKFCVLLLLLLLAVPSLATSLNVPIYSQKDSAWSGKWLASGGTMASIGCVVTSISMVMRAYGGDVDPGRLCDWLNANSGFTSDGSLASWSRPVGYPSHGSMAWVESKDWSSVAADLNYIRSKIDQGYPLIVKTFWNHNMSYQHWVVVTGYSGDDIYINDPLYGDNVRFQDRYGDPGRWIYASRLYSGSTNVNWQGQIWEPSGGSTVGYSIRVRGFVWQYIEQRTIDTVHIYVNDDFKGDCSYGGYDPAIGRNLVFVKDGVDMAPYAGQTVNIRAIARDYSGREWEMQSVSVNVQPYQHSISVSSGINGSVSPNW